MKPIVGILIVAAMLIHPLTTLAASDDLPDRNPDNLIIAAYNIQFLGERQHDLQKLAEVIQHFDVCGILEVKSEFAVRTLTEVLEEVTEQDWGYVYGIRTHRPSGTYHEAFAAVWRRDRVQLGDGLISNVWDLEEAYRNDPFMVSFKSGEFDFCLFLIHTRWSNDAEGTRESEVQMVAGHLNWMADFLPESDFIVAGDFNYSGDKEVMQEMAAACGLSQIDPNEKSTFKRDYSDYANPYDHIYINLSETVEYVDGSCRLMDATKVIYGATGFDEMRASKRELSDHLPVWAEFRTDGQDDD